MNRAVAHDALASELGAKPPKGVTERLTEEETDRLAQTIRAARDHQRRQLQEAGEAAFKHIPRLLRGPIRKVVGG